MGVLATFARVFADDSATGRNATGRNANGRNANGRSAGGLQIEFVECDDHTRQAAAR